MADACGLQHPQGAIPLGTRLLKIQRVVGRTTQCPIGVRRKRRAGETMRKRWTCPLRWAIHDRRRRCFRRFKLVGRGSFCRARWSTFGCTQLSLRELLPQFQSKIPNPLCEDLGELLAKGGYASTSGQIPARRLHRPARFQTSRDVDTDPAHRRQ